LFFTSGLRFSLIYKEILRVVFLNTNEKKALPFTSSALFQYLKVLTIVQNDLNPDLFLLISNRYRRIFNS